MKVQIIILVLALLAPQGASAGSYVVGSMSKLVLDAIDVDTLRYEPATKRLTFWVLDVDRAANNNGAPHDYTLVKQSTICGSDTYRIEYLVPYKFGMDGPVISGSPTLPEQQVIPDSSAARILEVACSAYKDRPGKTLDTNSETAAKAFRSVLNEYLNDKP